MSGGTKHDAEKPQYDLIPLEILEEVARVLQFGSERYGKNNWQNGIEIRRLISATCRHLFAFQSGQTNDPESGLNHVSHAIANLLFILWMLKNKPEYDNR